MSILEDDGFVIIEKGAFDAEDDDDVVSVSSSRSSLCLVEDPAKDSEALLSAGETQQELGKAKSGGQTPLHALPAKDAETLPEPIVEIGESGAVPRKQPKYVCSGCSSDVAAQADLVWEGYMGANKAAFLFSKVLNTEASAEPRKQQLSTGLFLLQDIHCKTCAVPLGWSYLRAWNQEQKYKEGSAIVQQSLLQLKGDDLPES